ncbi:MAG: tetratricopeptide repeat-containing sulfotransferase family protein [Steroidobacteraceae bacterium]
MSEIRLKSPTGIVGTAPNSTNPLREAREQLEQAEGLRTQGKFDRAESILASLVRRYPDYFGAQHTLGLVFADRGNYRRAVEHLVQAAMLNPRSWMTHTALAGVYLRLDAKEMAAHTLEQARTIKPKEPTILVTLGEIYSEEREYELARDAFHEAREVEPGMAEATIGFAYACIALGRHAEAADALERALKRGARSLGLLEALVSLPASVIRNDVLPELDRLVRSPGEDKTEFETGAAFVRAAALDSAGRHAEAWRHALAANQLVMSKKKDELTRHEHERQARLKWLHASSFNAKPYASGDEKLPITLFILGPSRSGKTTMEGLVSNLDGVVRGYENPSVENSISRAYQSAGLLTAWTLDHLPPQFYPSCREIYVEELARRAGAAKVFTNTHPVYIHDAARLATILPNVRFIFVKRDLEDITLRIYMRKYNKGNAYSYDVKAAREHVVWYYQMIDVLAEKLPNIARVIQYEDIVADPASALRAAADLCSLSVNDTLPLEIGDDRDCAVSYREFIHAEINS